jgi:DNA repair protein RadC
MTSNVGIGCEDDKVCPLCQSPYTPPRNTHIRTTKDVLACVKHFRNKKQEYFICLSLDSAQRLIARRIVTIGLLDKTLVHPREVFAGPILDRAASVVVVHNHLSGLARPSDEDIGTTQHLVAASQLLGMRLQDHVIATSKSFYSFRRHRLL